jgi:hypothetical protein
MLGEAHGHESSSTSAPPACEECRREASGTYEEDEEVHEGERSVASLSLAAGPCHRRYRAKTATSQKAGSRLYGRRYDVRRATIRCRRRGRCQPGDSPSLPSASLPSSLVTKPAVAKPSLTTPPHPAPSQPIGTFPCQGAWTNPAITVSPTTAARGAVVRVTGMGFCANEPVMFFHKPPMDWCLVKVL